MDIKRPIQTSISEEESEYKRRVWWVHYISNKSKNIFNNTIFAIDDKDTFVKPPSNDYRWKFGGKIKCGNKQVDTLRKYVNSRNDSQLPKDHNLYMIKGYTLFARVMEFVKRRHRNKVNINEDNYKFNTLEKYLGEYKKEIRQHLSVSLSSTKKLFQSNVNLFSSYINDEKVMFSYISRQLLNSITVHLYQSDLVKSEFLSIPPNRIKTAKKKSIKAAISQAELLIWCKENVPIKYWEIQVIPWTINSTIHLVNMDFIADHELSAKSVNMFERAITIYKELQETTENIEPLANFILYLKSLKVNNHNTNTGNITFEAKRIMRPLSISNLDTDPWIVPIHGTFFNSLCCIDSNFSTLDVLIYTNSFRNTINSFNLNMWKQNEPKINTNTNSEVDKMSDSDSLISDNDINFDSPNKKIVSLLDSFRYTISNNKMKLSRIFGDNSSTNGSSSSLFQTNSSSSLISKGTSSQNLLDNFFPYFENLQRTNSVFTFGSKSNIQTIVGADDPCVEKQIKKAKVDSGVHTTNEAIIFTPVIETDQKTDDRKKSRKRKMSISNLID
ncbi:hypothetical protein BB558_006016 [Smittium angustum]|uniref:Transcription factor domain-containing protein n=1 Tax=Smittium angustum TaxID=133377 RepID=A0A2U1IYV4_SMIAN|nr:hypothetical protein BB558_006016 [Smittium angustum]